MTTEERITALELRVAKIDQALRGNGMKGIMDMLHEIITDFDQYKERDRKSTCYFITDAEERAKHTKSWWMKHGIIVKDMALLIAMAGLIITILATWSK